MWLLPKLEKIQNALLYKIQISIMSVHVGSRLIYFLLLVVDNFFLVLSVVSNIFRQLSLLGYPPPPPLVEH